MKTSDAEIVKAFDILDKFEFFGGQRAGRELWFDKPVDVQNEDIEGFVRDIKEIRDLINRLKAENKNCGVKIQNQREQLKACNEKIKEQQAEIERLVNIPPKDPMDFCGVVCNYAEELIEKAKSEACKEFAEKIKEESTDKYFNKSTPFSTFIDNLLKEMG